MFFASAKPRVLVADGYADAADSLDLVLKFWGYDARVAYSGPEALLMAQRHRPHVAILELRLDGIDGYRLADRLRQVDPDIILVAVTSQADAASRRRSRASGYAAHLIKPVEPERLRRVLAALGGAHGLEEARPGACQEFESNMAACEWGELFERSPS
jgi:two-component system, OmpR family, response regulator